MLPLIMAGARFLVGGTLKTVGRAAVGAVGGFMGSKAADKDRAAPTATSSSSPSAPGYAGSVAASAGSGSGGMSSPSAPNISSTPLITPGVTSRDPTSLLQNTVRLLGRISGQLSQSLQLDFARARSDRENFLERHSAPGVMGGGSGPVHGASLGEKAGAVATGVGITALLAILARNKVKEKVHETADAIRSVGTTTKQVTQGLGQAIREKVIEPISGAAKDREIHLRQRARKAGMNRQELNQFMGQMSHESGSFKHMEEIWTNTKAQRNYWHNKNLGNKSKDDGYRYRGRGYIQLTGRYNYKHYGDLIGVDLINHPELAAHPEIAERIALAYWDEKIRKTHTNYNDTRAVTKKINGGYNGLEDRRRRVLKYSQMKDDETLATGGIMPTLHNKKPAAVNDNKPVIQSMSIASNFAKANKWNVNEVKGRGINGAIQINGRAGVIEAEDAQTKKKFDYMAKKYASMGYVVLWNGKRYDPDGSTRELTKSEGLHRDHMQVESVTPAAFKKPMVTIKPPSKRPLPPKAPQQVANDNGGNTYVVGSQGSKQMAYQTPRSGNAKVADPSASLGSDAYRVYFNTSQGHG
jgi:predicted chitinase